MEIRRVAPRLVSKSYDSEETEINQSLRHLRRAVKTVQTINQLTAWDAESTRTPQRVVSKTLPPSWRLQTGSFTQNKGGKKREDPGHPLYKISNRGERPY